MIRQPGSERLTAIVIATTLHVTVGFALFLAARSGITVPAPSYGGAHGAMLVRLLPFDRAGPPQQAAGPQSDLQTQATRTDDPVRPTPHRAGGQAASPVLATASLSDQHPAPPSTIAGTRTDAPAVTDLPSAEMLAYRARLQAHLAQYRLYPAAARNDGGQGIVCLHFIMNRQGSVVEAWIESSSGITAIDREALAAVDRAQPLPSLPNDFPDRLDIRLPVSFKLN